MTMRKRRQPHSKEGGNERGSIVVEAVFSFTIYIFAVMFIILLTNLYIVHNRVQFAVNSAVNQVASYWYLYDLSGIRDGVNTVNADGEPYQKKLNIVVTGVSSAANLFQNITGGNISGSIDAYNTAKNDVPAAVEELKNPKDLAIGAAYMMFDRATAAVLSTASEQLTRFVTKGYLSTDDYSADDYLKAYGVIGGFNGLTFDGTYNDSAHTIDIKVSYEVNIPYLGLFLADPNISVTQEVCVYAWLDGDGTGEKLDGYKGK